MIHEPAKRRFEIPLSRCELPLILRIFLRTVDRDIKNGRLNHMEKMKADALTEIEETTLRNRDLLRQREKSINISSQQNIYLFGVGVIALLVGMILGILLF